MMARFRKEVMGARLILVEGTVQKSEEEVVHLVAHRLIDRTHDLGRLSDGSLETAALPEAHADAERAPWRSERNSSSGRRHPRNIRILPRSRDFH
jgi:error-prone DNA polymerase